MEHKYYIDIAKAIGIISIVLGHVYADGPVRQVLYAFHVPLFFFLSGLFIKTNKNTVDFVINKIKTILVPYYMIAFLSIVIYSIFGTYAAKVLGKNLEEFGNTGIIDNLLGMIFGSSRNNLMNWNRPLWFLPCLFLTVLLAFMLEKYVIKERTIVRGCIVACSMAGGYLAWRETVILPFQAECSVNMLVWMEMAIMFAPRVLSKKSLEKKAKIQIVILIALLILAGIMSFANDCVNVRINEYGNLFFYYITAGVFITGILWFAMIINRNRVLEYIGQNTMIILLLHKFPILFFQSICPVTKRLLQNIDSLESNICAIIVALITILSCLIIQQLFKFGEKLIKFH